jgi:hypothetical protein
MNSLLSTIINSAEKYSGKWQPTTSTSCFTVSAQSDALSICHYLDSSNVRNVSIFEVDGNGYIKNKSVVNQAEDPELFQIVYDEYEKIRQQVRNNKVENISTLLNSEAASDNINHSNIPV